MGILGPVSSLRMLFLDFLAIKNNRAPICKPPRFQHQQETENNETNSSTIENVHNLVREYRTTLINCKCYFRPGRSQVWRRKSPLQLWIFQIWLLFPSRPRPKLKSSLRVSIISRFWLEIRTCSSQILDLDSSKSTRNPALLAGAGMSAVRKWPPLKPRLFQVSLKIQFRKKNV